MTQSPPELDLQKFLTAERHAIHLIGVAGSGMSGIAALLLELGHDVRGSDKVRTLETDRLTQRGLCFSSPHRAEETRDAELIIYSSAIREDNLILLDARRRSVPAIRRAEALAAIMNSPWPSSQIDIAKRLRIEGPTMTRMLDTLEADGLVERIADPSDRRSKHLRLTEAGEAVLEEVFGIVDDLRERLIAGLETEQIDELNGVLTTLTGRLDDGLPST